MTRFFVLMPLFAVACPPAGTVNEADCATVCADLAGQTDAQSTDGSQPETVGLTSFEQSVLKDVIEDVRAGVRPFDEQSLGICPKGENPRRCDTMLGATPGELAEGEYILYGAFRVPNAGEPDEWKVELTVECAVSKALPDGSVKTDKRAPYTREYKVLYSGKEKGYTLSPMRRITSPGPNGAEACTYTISSPHGDGAKEYSGGWSVPAGPR